MNIALEKESYKHSFLEKESSSVSFFLMVFLSGVYTCASFVVYIEQCIWKFTKGIEYEACVGCDSEFHAYGDHQTAMITKTQ